MARSPLFHFGLTLSLILLPLAGCGMPALNQHAVAFAKATDTVVDGSADAYRAANQLRRTEQVTAAIYAYDRSPAWDPTKDLKPLLTPEQLEARVTALAALKAYADSLVQLSNPKPSPDLQAASTGAGAALLALNTSVATVFATALPNAPVLSTTEANGVSTAILALGDYLESRKIKGSLPRVVDEQNQNIRTLCTLLQSDIKILRRQADVDYTLLLQDQDGFIRRSTLAPVEHRAQVALLIQIADQQKANDLLLVKLDKALHTLYLTHQALAAALQGNNPDSINQRIAELQAIGNDLAAYYKSLPTS
jgi:hypothetical protein